MPSSDAAGVRFENRMLERYGCGNVLPVAGARHASFLHASILSKGVFVSPEFFAIMLCSWFGGFPAGFHVRALTVGQFEFEVAHAGVAWEIVRKGRWSSGVIRVRISLRDNLSHPARDGRAGARPIESCLPSLLGPPPARLLRPPSSVPDAHDLRAPDFLRSALSVPAWPSAQSSSNY